MKRHMKYMAAVLLLLWCGAVCTYGAEYRGEGEYQADTGMYEYRFSDGTSFTGSVKEDDVVQDVVCFDYPSSVEGTVTLEGAEQPFQSGSYLVSSGEYRTVFTHGDESIVIPFKIIDLPGGDAYDADRVLMDYVESTQTYSELKGGFVQKIGDLAEFVTSVPDGMVTDRAVNLQLGLSDYYYILTKDGEEVDYVTGRILTEPGAYHLQVMVLPQFSEEETPEPTLEQLRDENYQMEEWAILKNDRTVACDFYFSIVSGPVNHMDYINAPKGYRFGKVWKDGAECPGSTRRYFHMEEDGEYRFTWEPEAPGNPPLSSAVTRDTTAPLLIFTNMDDKGLARGYVEFESTDPTARVEASCDGNAVLSEGSRLDSTGLYRITAEDKAGNATVYLVNVRNDSHLKTVFAGIFLCVLGGAGLLFLYYKLKDIQVR